MSRVRGFLIGFLGLLVVAMAVPRQAHAQQVIYSNIPSTIPPSVASFGYQANQLAEIGDLVSFGGTARNLSTVSVLLSDWAYQSEWASSGYTNPAGYSVPLTFNIYNVGAGNTVGSLLATMTQTTLIPWRAEPNPAQCGSQVGYATFGYWYGSDNACHGGEAFLLSFDFSAQNVVLPNQVVYGLAFNTYTWGFSPIGVDGPYSSLNFGATLSPPTVGSSAAGIGAEAYGSTPDFQTDEPWTYKTMAEFSANDLGTTGAVSPEPATMSLMAMGLAGMAGIGARRKRRQKKA